MDDFGPKERNAKNRLLPAEEKVLDATRRGGEGGRNAWRMK